MSAIAARAPASASATASATTWTWLSSGRLTRASPFASAWLRRLGAGRLGEGFLEDAVAAELLQLGRELAAVGAAADPAAGGRLARGRDRRDQVFGACLHPHGGGAVVAVDLQLDSGEGAGAEGRS